MTKKRGMLFILLAGALAVGLVLSRSAYMRVSVPQTDSKDTQGPVAESANAGTKNPKRQAKNNRYNRPQSAPITEPPPNVEQLPLNAHWWQGLSALPVNESDVVILGEVVDRKAYLSSDRSNVYSEFIIRVEQVFKGGGQVSLAPDSTLVAQRLGGAVRFPSGRTQQYRISRQYYPQNGKRYVLFLKRSSEDYDLLTGYELKGGRIFPLDGDDTDHPNGQLPFDKYKGANVDAFLNDLRETVNNGSQTSAN